MCVSVYICVFESVYLLHCLMVCVRVWGSAGLSCSGAGGVSWGLFTVGRHGDTADANSREQMAEPVSMPALCQGSEGAVQPVRRQPSSK